MFRPYVPVTYEPQLTIIEISKSVIRGHSSKDLIVYSSTFRVTSILTIYKMNLFLYSLAIPHYSSAAERPQQHSL